MSKENEVYLGVQTSLDEEVALFHERPVSGPMGFRAGTQRVMMYYRYAHSLIARMSAAM